MKWNKTLIKNDIINYLYQFISENDNNYSIEEHNLNKESTLEIDDSDFNLNDSESKILITLGSYNESMLNDNDLKKYMVI